MVEMIRQVIRWSLFKETAPGQMWRRDGDSVVLVSGVILLVADDPYVRAGSKPPVQIYQRVEKTISKLVSAKVDQPLPRVWDAEWGGDLQEFAVRVRSTWFQVELVRLAYMLPGPAVYGLADVGGHEAMVVKGAGGSLLCIAGLSRKTE